MIDGTVQIIGGNSQIYDSYKSNITAELAQDTNLAIELLANITSTDGYVTARITATDPVTETQLRVRFFVYEDDKYAEGTNGEAIHRFVVRQMLSPYYLTISAGQTVDATRVFSLDPTLDYRRLGIVVFVQSDASHRVLQAATHDFVPENILHVDDDDLMDYEVPYNEILTETQISYSRWNKKDMMDTWFPSHTRVLSAR